MMEYTNPPARLTEYSGAELIWKIEEMLLGMGMMRHLKGYGYLCRAIELVYTEPDAIRGVVKGLYSRIAEENGTTACCVERDCRTAIRFLFKKGEQRILSEYFFLADDRVPAVREFVAMLADRMRRNLISDHLNGVLGGRL